MSRYTNCISSPTVPSDWPYCNLDSAMSPSVYPQPINACRHHGRGTIKTTDQLRMTAPEEEWERVNGDPFQSSLCALWNAPLSGSRRIASLLFERSISFSLALAPTRLHYRARNSYTPLQSWTKSSGFWRLALSRNLVFLKVALVMETREVMGIVTEGGRSCKSGSNLTEAIGSPVREPQGKLSQRSCLSPDSYSRDRAELVMDESSRTTLCADVRSHGTPSSGERHRSDHHHKDGSSTDNESDFYEEIDVSCTPESMDYPTAKGGFWHQCAFVWFEMNQRHNRLRNQLFKHTGAEIETSFLKRAGFQNVSPMKSCIGSRRHCRCCIAVSLHWPQCRLQARCGESNQECFCSSWIISPSRSILAWM